MTRHLDGPALAKMTALAAAVGTICSLATGFVGYGQLKARVSGVEAAIDKKADKAVADKTQSDVDYIRKRVDEIADHINEWSRE